MSAVPGGLGPVSVRYAAQIKDLLQTQALERAAAEEAARAEKIQKAARVEPVEDAEPVKVDVETSDNQAAPIPFFAAPAKNEPLTAILIDLEV